MYIENVDWERKKCFFFHTDKILIEILLYYLPTRYKNLSINFVVVCLLVVRFFLLLLNLSVKKQKTFETHELRVKILLWRLTFYSFDYLFLNHLLFSHLWVCCFAVYVISYFRGIMVRNKARHVSQTTFDYRIWRLRGDFTSFLSLC